MHRGLTRDLRPLHAPRPVRVTVDEAGRPLRVARAGRPGWRRVARIRDRWRIDDEWWRARPIARLYYDLLLEDGALLTVYRDLLRGDWFEQRDGGA